MPCSPSSSVNGWAGRSVHGSGMGRRTSAARGSAASLTEGRVGRPVVLSRIGACPAAHPRRVRRGGIVLMSLHLASPGVGPAWRVCSSCLQSPGKSSRQRRDLADEADRPAVNRMSTTPPPPTTSQIPSSRFTTDSSEDAGSSSGDEYGPQPREPPPEVRLTAERRYPGGREAVWSESTSIKHHRRQNVSFSGHRPRPL